MGKLISLVFTHLVLFEYTQALKCYTCYHATGIVDEYSSGTCETSNPNQDFLVDCEYYLSQPQETKQRFLKPINKIKIQGNSSTDKIARQQTLVFACEKVTIKGRTDDTDMEIIERGCVVFDVKNAVNTDKCTSGKIFDMSQASSYWGAVARVFLNSWYYGELQGSTHFTGCYCSTDGCNSVGQLKIGVGTFSTILTFGILLVNL